MSLGNVIKRAFGFLDVAARVIWD